MKACYGGTDVMERSCAVARGIDINKYPKGELKKQQLTFISGQQFIIRICVDASPFPGPNNEATTYCCGMARPMSPINPKCQSYRLAFRIRQTALAGATQNR
jgi:hypothetical protein